MPEETAWWDKYVDYQTHIPTEFFVPISNIEELVDEAEERGREQWLREAHIEQKDVFNVGFNQARTFLAEESLQWEHDAEDTSGFAKVIAEERAKALREAINKLDSLLSQQERK